MLLDNERLTDCCAFYVGFGDRLIRGCESQEINAEGIKSIRIGYLSYAQYKYIDNLLFQDNYSAAEEGIEQELINVNPQIKRKILRFNKEFFTNNFIANNIIMITCITLFCIVVLCIINQIING